MQDYLTTRRLFLQRGLTLLAATPTIPAFLDQTVMALANPLDTPLTQQPSGKDGKVLVVVQLAGGNDGLNTVIPFADDTYHRVRPVIMGVARSFAGVSRCLSRPLLSGRAGGAGCYWRCSS